MFYTFLPLGFPYWGKLRIFVENECYFCRKIKCYG